MAALSGHPTSLVPRAPKGAARHDPHPAIAKCPPALRSPFPGEGKAVAWVPVVRAPVVRAWAAAIFTVLVARSVLLSSDHAAFGGMWGHGPDTLSASV